MVENPGLEEKMVANFQSINQALETITSRLLGMEQNFHARLLEVEGKNRRRDSVLNALPDSIFPGAFDLGASNTPAARNVGGGPAQPSSPAYQTAPETPVVSIDAAVDDKLKMNSIYPRAFAKTVRVCAQYNQEHKQTKRLVFFLTSEVVRELYTHEKSHNKDTQDLLQEHMYWQFRDDRIKLSVARFCRPQNADKFGTLLFDNVHQLYVKSNWNFGVEGYHETIGPQILIICQDITDVCNLLAYDATSEELAKWPKPGYTKGDKGDKLANYFMKLMREYEAQFEQLLTMDALKQVKTAEDFVTLLSSHNAKLTKESRALADIKLTFQPPQKLADLMAQHDNRRNQYKFKKGLEYKNPKLSVMESIGEQNYVDEDEGTWLFGYNEKPPQRPDQGRPSYAAKPKERTLVCYQFAKTGKCELGSGNKCVYSHDPLIAKEFLAKTLESLLTSPFIPEPGKAQLRLTIKSIQEPKRNFALDATDTPRSFQDVAEQLTAELDAMTVSRHLGFEDADAQNEG